VDRWMAAEREVVLRGEVESLAQLEALGFGAGGGARGAARRSRVGPHLGFAAGGDPREDGRGTSHQVRSGRPRELRDTPAQWIDLRAMWEGLCRCEHGCDLTSRPGE